MPAAKKRRQPSTARSKEPGAGTLLRALAQPVIDAALEHAKSAMAAAYSVRVPGAGGRLVCFGTRDQILNLLKPDKPNTPKKRKQHA